MVDKDPISEIDIQKDCVIIDTTNGKRLILDRATVNNIFKNIDKVETSKIKLGGCSSCGSHKLV